MILILGGLASGKRTYVKEVLGYSDRDMADGLLDSRPVIYNVQNLVRENPQGCEALLSALTQKEVVVVNEVGCGIIPMDKSERDIREQTGRLTIQLAKHAARVVRMMAGLPKIIKE